MLKTKAKRLKYRVSQHRHFFTDAGGPSNGHHLSRGELCPWYYCRRSSSGSCWQQRHRHWGCSSTHIPGRRSYMFSSSLSPLYVCLTRCTGMPVEARVASGCLPLLLFALHLIFFFFLRQVSCWSWISLFQLHKLFNELLTLLVALWLKVQATMSNFYMGSGHPNSGPSICTSKTLPSEPPSFGPVGSFQSGIKEAWGHVSTIFYPYYCLCSAHILSHMLNHL